MDKSHRVVLTIIALAQFMVVLDVTVVNVALPHIQSDLHFSSSGLQWVVSAYTLLFGGFLLLGGRTADLLGRRAVFMAGLALFTTASLVAGLSTSPTMMIIARAFQGFGGALLSPSALSLLTTTFTHGRQRNIALGIWGALGGLGGTLGVVVGGLLVDGPGWRWVFFVNVPVGIALILLARRRITESQTDAQNGRHFDALGALIGTTALLALVFGVVRTQVVGWSSAEVIACLAAGVVLLAGFVTVERRATAPLVPLSLFRTRALRTGSVSIGLNGATFLAMFFLTSIFLQSVRGDSPLTTGLQVLPMGAAAVLAAITASRLVTTLGTRPVQLAGTVLSVAGLLLLSRAGAHDSYVGSLLPGLLLFGAGIVSVGVPAQVAAQSDVQSHHAGSASGVVNAAYQIGGALGLAVITTIANSRVNHLEHVGTPAHAALTSGFQRGLLIAAILAAANLLFSLRSPQVIANAEQTAAGAAA